MRTFWIALPALVCLAGCLTMEQRQTLGSTGNGNSGGSSNANTGQTANANNGSTTSNNGTTTTSNNGTTSTRCTAGPIANFPEPTGCLRTFHVSVSGSDSAAGSQAAPWKTLQKAADTVIAGDCVRVHVGSYNGFTMGWDVATTGTQSNPIIFQADDGVTITHRATRTADGIDLEPGTDYVYIYNFNVENDGSITRAGIRTTGKYTRVVHNRSNANGTWGVLTGFTDGFVAECNIVSNNVQQHGIYVGNTSQNIIVRNNVSFGNGGCGLHFNGDVSMSEDGNTPRGTILNALVEGNLIYNNGTRGGSGINMDGVQDSVIRNNVLYNNHASGISLFQIDAAEPAKRNQVIGNTIAMPSDGRWALNIANGSSSNTVANNIFYSAHPTRGSITIDSAGLSGFVSDYNLVIDRMSADGDNSTISFASWKQTTGQDTHSKLISQVSSLFANFAGADFRLKVGSAAIDAGMSQPSHALDFLGVSRPQGNGFDIGAYESY